MALGPGKYDDLCTYVREQAEADGVMLIVIGGSRGNGLAAQMTGDVMVQMATILRELADSVENDMKIMETKQ